MVSLLSEGAVSSRLCFISAAEMGNPKSRCVSEGGGSGLAGRAGHGEQTGWGWVGGLRLSLVFPSPKI